MTIKTVQNSGELGSNIQLITIIQHKD